MFTMLDLPKGISFQSHLPTLYSLSMYILASLVALAKIGKFFLNGMPYISLAYILVEEIVGAYSCCHRPLQNVECKVPQEC